MKLLYVILIILLSYAHSFSRDQIKVVGSSTVYPFITIVAENFNNKYPKFKTPIIEANGTGGGIKLFCRSAGLESPDMVNASRPIKSSEINNCAENNIVNIIEIMFGYDAIVLIAPKVLKDFSLSRSEIFLALSSKVPDSNGNLIDNPYKSWSDINPSLPSISIKVMGPPSSSGTRDSFTEMVLLEGCSSLKQAKKIISSVDCSTISKIIRADGHWIDGGENDVLLVRKAASSSDTLAITGYSYYEQNQKSVVALKIDGVLPNENSFKNNSYPLIRPLFVYIKKDNISFVPGLKEFLQELTSKDAIGDKGYLRKAGLVVLTQKEYENTLKKVFN
jgi:phosphate transport system substrate-binding protein